MARAKSTASRRTRVVKSKARGFKHARSRRVKSAKEALLHAGQYAYIGRKQKRRNLKTLWIQRLNAAVRKEGLTYSKFVKLLKDNKIELNRKMLAEIAVKDSETFKQIIKEVK